MFATKKDPEATDVEKPAPKKRATRAKKVVPEATVVEEDLPVKKVAKKRMTKA